MNTLAEAYAECEQLNRNHGKTYHWATRLLPADRRPEVHALYGLFRYADDIVDRVGADTKAQRAGIEAAERQFFSALDGSKHVPRVLLAPADTARRRAIPRDYFERFFRSMKMDLDVTRYETYDDLLVYMDGSAAVIGESLLPILDATTNAAHQPARDLGLAFQFTNFLRDIGEDLDRNRVYMPQEDLRRFGADPHKREVTPEWRAFMQFEIERNRKLYESAEAGLGMLPARSASCVRAAHRLYARILDKIEANDYDVFTRRATVPSSEKARTVAALSLSMSAKGSREAFSALTKRARGTTGAKKP